MVEIFQEEHDKHIAEKLSKCLIQLARWPFRSQNFQPSEIQGVWSHNPPLPLLQA